MSNASLDFLVYGTLVAQNVPFEDRNCSNLSTCFIRNTWEEACELRSSSVLRGVYAALGRRGQRGFFA